MKRNIMLIGAMGSGKSHLGRNLAEALGWQYVDTDRLLEKRYHQPIAEIFKRLGHSGFRAAEIDVLKKVSLYHEAVISVGGNSPIEVRTLKRLRRFSYIIGIRAAKFQIVRRVRRKIGKRPTMDYDNIDGAVHSMLQRWSPLYRRCDFVLDTTRGSTDNFIECVQRQVQKDGVTFKQRKYKRESDGE